MRKLPFTLAGAVAAALVAMSPATAHADESRGTVDWMKGLVELDRFARSGADFTPFLEYINAHSSRHEGTERQLSVVSTGEPTTQNLGTAWFGVAPHVTFVARDWANAFKLAGGQLSVVDATRLSESTRMVVTRVRLGDLRVSRITPFAQVGLGQWRTDTNLNPGVVRSMEIAGQAGGGLEIAISPTWQMAAESSVTALYREQRENNSIPQTRFYSVMLASRLQF